MQLADTILLQSTSQGDHQAFALLYDRYAGRVFGLIRTILQNQIESQDVLQETFLQVWQQAGQFDEKKARPEVWILLLARSRAIDRLRKLSKNRVSTQTTLPEPPASEAAVDEVLTRHESRQMICTALCTLPPDQQEPIRLAFYEGLTHVEIAHFMHIPLGTVKTRIRNGMLQLRQTLSQGGEGVS